MEFVSLSQTRVLLATIRDKGLCPCPRCLVAKSQLDRLGMARDQKTRQTIREFLFRRVEVARDAIYRLAVSITGTRVDSLLKDVSAVPTMVKFLIPYLQRALSHL